MCKRLITALLSVLLLSPAISAQETGKDNFLRTTVSSYGQATVIIPYPGRDAAVELSKSVSISSADGRQLEIVLSQITVEWFILQGFDYTVVTGDSVKGVEMASGVKHALEWDSYPTYFQYDSIMRSYARLYPELCWLDTIGISNYGKLVLVLKISDNAADDEDEPELFYSSTMHGDETGGFILMLRLAAFLLENYSSDQRARNLVDNLEIWINPLANPDGTYKTGNTISSPTRFNANGYDLNRNFPDPVSDDPVKQVETIDMMNFMKGRNFVLSANFHGGEEVVNYPWDRWERRHPDEDWFYSISRKYADTAHVYSPAGYMTFMENGVTNGWDWYYVYGGRQDYVTYELQGREITIELDDIKLTPAANLDLLWNCNWRSLLGYLENALHGIHGKVIDSVTGEPVPAKILIPGHVADGSFVFSDTLTGSFTRFAAAGTWLLQLSADGYKTRDFEVEVTDGVAVDIVVEMEPLVNPVDTVETERLFIYPNPAGEFIKVILPVRQIGNINIVILSSLGQKLADYNETTNEGSPLYINVEDLPRGVCILSLTNRDTNVCDRAKFVVLRRK
jgi:hypothetical protein